MERAKAWELLRAYNKDHFHLQHALTVEAVMRWFANDLGYGAEADYWGVVGLLHDIDFELYPEQHCVKCVELLQKGGVPEDMIHAIVSHGYGICADVAPEREMEKVLFACDELTGLIWAAALMRPSKSTKDMELKSLKKKYKDKKFAAGCSRDVIARGAEQLGWTRFCPKRCRRWQKRRTPFLPRSPRCKTSTQIPESRMHRKCSASGL